MSKKILIIVAVLLMTVFSGCSNDKMQSDIKNTKESDSISMKNDDSNAELSGAGRSNSELLNTNLYADKNIEPIGAYISPQEGRSYGEIQEIEYFSTVSHKYKKASIVLPAGYSEQNQYPVLYLLHGMGGNYRSWLDMGANYIVQNAHYDYGTPDMIVVIPSVFTTEIYNSEDGLNFNEISRGYDNFIGELKNNLIPIINSKYSVKTGKDNTAIAGYSLGGREASYIAFRYPYEFGYIGGFSATNGIFKKESWADVLLENYDFDSVKNNYRFIMYQVGVDDPYIAGVREFRDMLNQHGIKNMYYEMEGGHEGTVWQHGLYNFARRIFIS